MKQKSGFESSANRYRFKRLKGRTTVGVIYSPREFHAMVAQECDRAGRYQTRFSLAVFEVGTHDESSVLIRRLVRTIHNRFRNTDDLGWYRRGQIGIVMPFTPPEGAWKLAEYVSQVISSITLPPPFTIYSYPSQIIQILKLSILLLQKICISFFISLTLQFPLNTICATTTSPVIGFFSP